MKYERFEDLPVWKDAVELAVRIFDLAEDDAFKGKASLRDQLERAAVSVSNNIAEGFERGTTWPNGGRCARSLPSDWKRN
jgi:hypothetical protein